LETGAVVDGGFGASRFELGGDILGSEVSPRWPTPRPSRRWLGRAIIAIQIGFDMMDVILKNIGYGWTRMHTDKVIRG
jgi:hypothetical protein